MTAKVAIVTDSTSDLPPERTRELGIAVVPLTVHIDGHSFFDGTELTPEQFYQKLSGARAIPTTSQPSAGQFHAAYEALEADEIISIHISAKLSGTINSARIAADQLPAKRIRVFDSQSVSMALGYVVQTAAEAAASGEGLEAICESVQASIRQTGFLAVLETLHHAQKSGRIGFAQALLGSMLQVKPIIGIANGEVVPVDRPRTMRKAVDRLIDLTVRDAPFHHLAVPHAGNEELARDIAERLRLVHPGPIDVLATGAVVGTHCGPGAVACCYLK
ncbi:MAG: DegV family protein [Chloroflexota bacterium]|nr:DegV family protein [Chloroflexota bacterium]